MELIILNLETNKKFSKIFSNSYLAEQFKKKIRYSKKLKLVGEFSYEI